ncbi:MAG: hypothetical protein ACERLG_10370, partial [Sedimentibacter sp.]
MNKKDKYFEDYFEKKRNDISFITLKKGASVNFKDKTYILNKELPVPVRVNKLLEEIEKQNKVDGITLNNIIDGIIYVNGVDANFEFLNDYAEMLKQLDFDIKTYIIFCINKLESNELEDGVVYGRALVNIEENEKSCFIYASSLENMGIEHNAKGHDKLSQYFLSEANSYFERVLNYDEKFALA